MATLAMPSADIRLTPDGSAICAEAGFRLVNASSRIDTDRGRSIPHDPPRRIDGLHHQSQWRQIRPWALEFHQTLTNHSDHRAMIQRIVMLEGVLDLPGSAWHAMHTELFVTERHLDGYTHLTGSLLAPLAEVEGVFGTTENMPFPGIAFTHPERGTVLMATLTQHRCKPVWQLVRDGTNTRLTAIDHFDGIPAIPIEPGAELQSEHWVLLYSPGDFTQALDRYFELLPDYGSYVAPHSPLREQAVWGSWNYNRRPGGHGDITHDYIVANAAALATLHPKVRWVMIDDGYQRGCSTKAKGTFPPGVDVFHGSEPAHDCARFPHGMDATATAIRATGLNPAIWLTPIVDPDGALARDRPDWLVRVAGRTRFAERIAYLDYSNAEVRQHFQHVWLTVFEQWGYAGLKLDFWTAMFEINGLQLGNPTRTAIEWRNDFLRDLRGFVPPDGYLLTCCTVNTGNPFLGQWADASRIGMDMGDGRWDDVFCCAAWATASHLFFRDHCLLADVDSIGWCDSASAGQNRAWATFALMCGTMCEIAGDITRLSPDSRRFLCQTLDAFVPGRKSRMARPLYGPGTFPADQFTSILPSSAREEAWFNWSNQIPRQVRPARHGIDHWTGTAFTDVCRIPPLSAVMLRRD